MAEIFKILYKIFAFWFYVNFLSLKPDTENNANFENFSVQRMNSSVQWFLV